jgi:hypothetical protein
MKITVQFPTFGRPEKFLKVLEQYTLWASGKNELFFNINCDMADLSMTSHFMVEKIREVFDLYRNLDIDYAINFDPDTEKISAINDHATDKPFDIIICASDDMVPKIRGWDEEIVRAMDTHFPDYDGCVHFDDGNTNGQLITFSILGRGLYETFGYIYHPDYKSLYCDDEFTQEVRRMGKEAYIPKVLFSHEHWSIEGSENHGDIDLAVQKTLHYSGRDAQVFQKRQELGFPKERITND